MANPNPPQENLTPWQPGQSGNPAGYSARRRVTDALVKMIADKGAENALAVTWLAMALGETDKLKGRNPDYRFFKELLDRIEGRVVERVELTQTAKGYKGETPDTLWTPTESEPTSHSEPPDGSGETPDPKSS